MLRIDIGLLIILLAVSVLVRKRFKPQGYSAIAAGGIVMSLGIFSTYALDQMPFYSSALGRIVTIEILVIWLFIAWSIGESMVHRRFLTHYKGIWQRFAIGTWVAGTAILATLVRRDLPEASDLALALAAVAIAIYTPYVVNFVQAYWTLWRHPFRQRATGIVLLPTVATESLIIMLITIFGKSISPPLALGIIAFDLVFLTSGQILTALHFRKMHTAALASEWPNANCIIHGGVSITGLTLTLSGDFGPLVLFGVWATCLLLLIVIESLEVVRAAQRIRRYGLTEGVLTYGVSQWARNFTFGMFYAFSFELMRHSASFPFNWSPVIHFIISYGQYAVLFFLIAETGLFLRAHLASIRAENATIS